MPRRSRFGKHKKKGGSLSQPSATHQTAASDNHSCPHAYAYERCRLQLYCSLSLLKMPNSRLRRSPGADCVQTIIVWQTKKRGRPYRNHLRLKPLHFRMSDSVTALRQRPCFGLSHSPKKTNPVQHPKIVGSTPRDLGQQVEVEMLAVTITSPVCTEHQRTGHGAAWA